MRFAVIPFLLGAITILALEHAPIPLGRSLIGEAFAQNSKSEGMKNDSGCELFENPTINGLNSWAGKMGGKGYKITALTTTSSYSGVTFVAAACK